MGFGLSLELLMNWRKINYGRAENGDGVSVTRVGYKSLKYERTGRQIRIDVEKGHRDLGVYACGAS
jgi:hypothetical protein